MRRRGNDADTFFAESKSDDDLKLLEKKLTPIELLEFHHTIGSSLVRLVLIANTVDHNHPFSSLGYVRDMEDDFYTQRLATEFIRDLCISTPHMRTATLLRRWRWLLVQLPDVFEMGDLIGIDIGKCSAKRKAQRQP